MATNGASPPTGDVSKSISINITNAKTVSSSSNNSTPIKQEGWYYLQIFQSILNLLAHLFKGITLGLCLMFTFRNGLPLTTTPLHYLICTIGYQFIMAEAILSMSADNGWSSKLKFVDKRRAHWILLIVGSVLALYGSYVKYAVKSVHWNSLHSKYSLVAIVFTVASLVNGLTSLWAYELRGYINASFSKITHICFGIVAFASASICLCYGYEKRDYKAWATEAMTTFSIVVAVVFTVIIIINPCITFYRRSMSAVKKSY